MKNNKFLNICIGLGILFLSGGFFLRSITTANAAPPSPAEFVDGVSKIGKYQLALNSANGDQNAMIIDTETGQTYLYVYQNFRWTSAVAPPSPAGK